MSSSELEDRPRRLLGRLEDDGVAGGQRGGELPGRHQDREVPRDDLRDHAERLVEVVGDGVVVDLAARALLPAQHAGEVAEVVDGQRQVGGQRLADRLAVVPRLGDGQRLEVLLDAVGDPVEDERSARPSEVLPQAGAGGVRGVQGGLDVLGGAAADLGEGPAGHRGDVLEVLALLRLDPVAADEVPVARLDRDLRALGSGGCVDRHRCSPNVFGGAPLRGWGDGRQRNVATTLQRRRVAALRLQCGPLAEQVQRASTASAALRAPAGDGSGAVLAVEAGDLAGDQGPQGEAAPRQASWAVHIS